LPKSILGLHGCPRNIARPGYHGRLIVGRGGADRRRDWADSTRHSALGAFNAKLTIISFDAVRIIILEVDRP